MVSVETLVLVHQRPKILLAMKKRKFGAGHYNGFGGKVEEGESLRECAIRETYEEGGIKILNPEHVGKILFKFLESDEPDHDVHLFRVLDYEGEPAETEEMAPAWFDEDKIPFDEMWPDDKFWMPLFLAGKKFVGEFHFKGKEIVYLELKIVEDLDEKKDGSILKGISKSPFISQYVFDKDNRLSPLLFDFFLDLGFSLEDSDLHHFLCTEDHEHNRDEREFVSVEDIEDFRYNLKNENYDIDFFVGAKRIFLVIRTKEDLQQEISEKLFKFVDMEK